LGRADPGEIVALARDPATATDLAERGIAVPIGGSRSIRR
jgi:hypothetical protein